MNRRASLLATLGWLALAAASLFMLARLSDDYLTSIRSLQDLRWRIVRFVPPADDGDGQAELEIQNRSRLDLTVSQLELFLWNGNVSVGKTYDAGGGRLIRGGESLGLPLALVVNAGAMADARARAAGQAPRWALTGNYKVSTPLSDFNLLYRLQLDLP